MWRCWFRIYNWQVALSIVLLDGWIWDVAFERFLDSLLDSERGLIVFYRNVIQCWYNFWGYIFIIFSWLRYINITTSKNFWFIYFLANYKFTSVSNKCHLNFQIERRFILIFTCLDIQGSMPKHDLTSFLLHISWLLFIEFKTFLKE